MRPGVVIAGKYAVRELIGEGGMGTVWRAKNVITGRDVALKMLRQEVAVDPHNLARFLQEARVSSRFRHPTMVEVFDAGTAQDVGAGPFLVMELLDGISLDRAIAKLGKLAPAIAMEIIGTVARGLSVAHGKNVIHRDLKPANIFLHRPGTGGLIPKILDFGISKITDGLDEDSMKLTRTGTVVGSPLYMSPEQAASDKSLDGRSDVHALGVVLWECLVGDVPFSADTYNNLVVEIMTQERPRLEDHLPDAPAGLSAIIARAFATKREDRYASAGEFADALFSELSNLGWETTLDRPDAASKLFGLLSVAPQRQSDFRELSLARTLAAPPSRPPPPEPRLSATDTNLVAERRSAMAAVSRRPLLVGTAALVSTLALGAVLASRSRAPEAHALAAPEQVSAAFAAPSASADAAIGLQGNSNLDAGAMPSSEPTQKVTAAPTPVERHFPRAQTKVGGRGDGVSSTRSKDKHPLPDVHRGVVGDGL